MRLKLSRHLGEWAPIALRLALGVVFMARGWEKLNGPLGTPAGFNIDDWGWPFPVFWAWLVALVETFGGLLIVVGLFTRIAAALIACAVIVAIVKVEAARGFVDGFDFELVLLMIAVALALGGPGRLSVDLDVLRPSAAPNEAPGPGPDD